MVRLFPVALYSTSIADAGTFGVAPAVGVTLMICAVFSAALSMMTCLASRSTIDDMLTGPADMSNRDLLPLIFVVIVGCDPPMAPAMGPSMVIVCVTLTSARIVATHRTAIA